jgi:hypothetical protein
MLVGCGGLRVWNGQIAKERSGDGFKKKNLNLANFFFL